MITSFLFHFYRLLKPIVFPFFTQSGSSNSCRFHPTCSQYCRESVRYHGVIRGSYLCFKRLLRCHPLSKHPYHDPVPH